LRDRLLAIVGFADNLEASFLLQKTDQTLSKKGVIVSQQ
jgi:hypothetical protein